MRDGEQPPTTGDGALRLTYQEIAARLCISGEAARQLVRRRKWQRIKPNRLGAPAIVVVPEDELAGEEWRPNRRTPPNDPGSPLEAAPVDPHTNPDDRLRKGTEINSLIALLTTEHERADQAEANLRTLQTELLVEKEGRARAEGGAEALRVAHEAHLADLHNRVMATEKRAEAAEAEAARLRQEEADRRALGLRQRLWLAWWGR